MRTTKSLTISLPPEQLREMEKTAKKENRTMSELMREAFRRYQTEQAERRLLADPLRASRLQALKQSVDALRKEAVASGVSRMSMREINAAVAATRQTQKKTSKRPAK
jgi:Arc/MetJ-type ribon-helix-helix transcriptional regulator